MIKFLFLCLLFPVTALADSYVVGQRNIQLIDQSRNRSLAAFVWYPATAASKVAVNGKAGPFQPVVSAMDAPFAPKPGRFPVVILSHGSGGTADKLFWLTGHLVKNGVVVIAVNHTGNMTGDSSGKGLIEVWNRPVDLTFALDQISSRAEFKHRLDLTKVGAVGHSAGGTTVLLLAGARLSYDHFGSPVPNCSGTKDPYFAVWCQEIQKIDVKSYGKKVIAGDYRDARVRAVVALDPGFARSFEPGSLVSVKDRTRIFLADKLRTPFDEIYSKDFLKLVDGGSVTVVPNSIHMSFLQACVPHFPKDDAELRELCADNDLKIKIQRDTAQAALEFLKTKWK